MDDEIDMLADAKIQWVIDKFNAKAAHPRHLGRAVTFEYFANEDENDYASTMVLGILEGVTGTELIVSGDTYLLSRVSSAKIYRRKLV